MEQEWRDCIVTLIDVIGVKQHTQHGAGSSLMRKLHALVIRSKSDLPAVAHAYAWNDSVLLLSYVDRQNASFEAAIRDADKLKRQIDKVAKSYAIAVKGLAFPSAQSGDKTAHASGVTVIEASSWAMANCFEIEKVLKLLKKPWYIDERIAKRLCTCQTFETKMVTLLPSNQPRAVHVFDGYLW